MRKHWRGENPYTQEYFSSKSPGAKPEMLVWEAGYITREKAIVFLKKWEEVFRQEEYQIADSQLKGWKPEKRIRLTSAERVRFEGITFSNLKQGKATVSEELTSILEALFAEDIPAELEERTSEGGRTNLVTTMEYAMIHGKSQEQIKQYLHQSGRLTGRKFGRDWVIVDDEKLPQDRRKREVLA